MLTCVRPFTSFGTRTTGGGTFFHFSLIRLILLVLFFYLFFRVFFVFFVVKCRVFVGEAKAHFQREKKRDDGGGRAKREFCVQEFFLFWSFLSFDMPVVLYVWQTTNDDSIRSAPFLYHNPHRIV